MGNAHTHDRRKSGAPETGLTIEGIREKPLHQHERKQGRVEKKVGNDGPDKGPGGMVILLTSFTGITTKLPDSRRRSWRRRSGVGKYSGGDTIVAKTSTGMGEEGGDSGRKGCLFCNTFALLFQLHPLFLSGVLWCSVNPLCRICLLLFEVPCRWRLRMME